MLKPVQNTVAFGFAETAMFNAQRSALDGEVRTQTLRQLEQHTRMRKYQALHIEVPQSKLKGLQEVPNRPPYHANQR